MTDLFEGISTEIWRSGIFRDDVPCEWIPVVDIEGSLLALTKDGRWAFADNDEEVRLIRIESPKVYPGLPLLEFNFEEVSSKIEEALKCLGLLVDSLSFPYKWIILCGLNHPSEHWQLAALDWCELVGEIDELLEALKKLSLWGSSQQVQHKAKKVLKSNDKWDHFEMEELKKSGDKD